MSSKFFIERPILSSVISIVIVIAGLVTLFGLPIAQYPEITPPTVQVSAVYPGASAEVISQTVAAPIEQEVNGVEGMIYMSSTSASDGSYSLTVSFEVGTDLDLAQILVQNRVALAEPSLPEEVVRQGVSTKKQSTNIVMIVSLSSPDGRYDELFLSNFATLQLRDRLSRVEGVGEVSVFPSSDYSMRIWLDPQQLRSREITTQEVLAAVREQNVQVAAGQIGQPPAPETQGLQLSVNVLGRLSEVEQFEDIIVKTSADGRIVRLRDVARVELGGQNYNLTSTLEGANSASVLIYQLPGANALQVATDVRLAMEEMSSLFPQGVDYAIPYDTTLFVQASIDGVVMTLFQAGALVFLVLFIFLQDWRATLVPAVTIPVALIGTFAVMASLGFSLNMLTLFGLVLAIGVVVDDSIVIVEATASNIEKGLSSKDAAIKAMSEVSGPVVATSLVLMAVFIPAAFLPGITGEMYRQFALTIAAATIFSTLNALTLSPALSALLLRPQPERKNAFFRGFDKAFAVAGSGYAGVAQSLLRRSFLAMLLFVGLLLLTGWQFGRVPTGFLPQEDQGYLLVNVQLPDGASLGRTNQVLRQIDDIVAGTDGVESWVSLGGFSLIDGTAASNSAVVFVVLTPWEERTDPALSADAILAGLQGRLFGIQEAVVFGFPPPAINGLGVSGGFQMQLQARGNAGLMELGTMAQELIADGNAQSGLANLNTTFRASVPQLFAEVNRTQAKRLGVSLDEIFGTLQAYLGSAYVNDFNRFGRTWQVKLQADHQFRLTPEDIRQLEVRNSSGEMVPVGALVDVDYITGPQTILRYNLYPTASITGQAAPGFSSGQALLLMEEMADAKLPVTMGYEWTGVSYQERQVGGEAIAIFGLAILLVFLVLAAQYESWTSPAAVILVVPLAILGTVVALLIGGSDNNVYTQIGIVLLIGLASKNAILIVEFARQEREGGRGILEAAAEAARRRFRPILMTAISSIAGFMPLLLAAGAGAASRQAVGNAVVGGMIAATIMSLLFTPVFYLVMQRLSERSWRKKSTGDRAEAPAE
ncbi:MAG: efflux RND transporter permease subunit [Kiloniellales bacterium]